MNSSTALLASTLNGPDTSNLIVNKKSFTDNQTAANGTAALFSATAFGQPTLSATNANVTTTNVATLYIGGAPKAGSNQTLTNYSYGLLCNANALISGLTNLPGGYVASGNAAAKVSGNSASSNMSVNANTAIKFPVIIYDRTNIYNANTGAFVVTQTGVYRFGIQIVQTVSSQNNYFLVVNGATVANISQRATGSGNDPATYCYNGTTDHYVTAGASVTIQCLSSTTIYCQDGQTSQFYCTLIS